MALDRAQYFTVSLLRAAVGWLFADQPAAPTLRSSGLHSS